MHRMILKDLSAQNLDDYEAEESFQLVFIDPETGIKANRSVKESHYNPMMFEREACVLEMLISEGVIG